MPQSDSLMFTRLQALAHEMWIDAKGQGLMVAMCSLVTLFIALIVYHVCAFGISLNASRHVVVDARGESSLYMLADIYDDPDEYAAFREDGRRVAAMGNFCNELTADNTVAFVSVFDQFVPVRHARGDQSFEYGTMEGSEGEASGYEDPEGVSVRNMRSIQMTRQAFDFFGLRIACGGDIPWDDVRYTEREVPVLLGFRYQDYYRVGETLEGWLYGELKTFRIVGFIDEDASIWYKGDADYALGSTILVPYPARFDADHIGSDGYASIIISAAFNGTLAVDRDMSAAELAVRLGAIANRVGYHDYALAGIPEYHTQLRLMGSLFETSARLVYIAVALIAMVGLAVVSLVRHIVARRRSARIRAGVLLGEEYGDMLVRLGMLWACEQATVFVCLLWFMRTAPDFSAAAASITVLCIAVLALCDGACRLRGLRRVMRPAVMGVDHD